MSQNLQSNLWMKTENFIDQICSFDGLLPPNRNSDTPMELYTLTYNYILQTSLSSAMLDRSVIHGGDLYHHIEICLQKRLNNIYQNVNGMTDENVFRIYKAHWDNYKTMCGFVGTAFSYLNQHWLRRELNSGRRDIYEIKVLCQKIWERIFFEPLFPHIIRICLNLIKMDRDNHSSVYAQSIKNILQLYLDTNLIKILHEGLQFESINDIYTEYFEIEFLREAQDFYRRQEISSFEPNQMLEYLTSVAKDFHYEINLARSCLLEEKSTLTKLIDILEEIFIPDDIFNIILDKIKPFLLNEDNHQELARLIEPINRIPKIKHEVIKFIEDYIHQMGIDTIKVVSETAVNDPKMYIKTILDIHKKFVKLVQELFNGEQDFTAALDKACGKFINNNAVTQTAGSTTKSPELLARYCDALLRKRSKAVEETDLEEEFNQIMIVFNYIEDKDVYLKFYQKMLAKRLIGQLSASDDDEESMISKLKQTCGCEYTSKLERMFQDIRVSKTLIVEYEDYCKKRHVTDTVDFSIMVLSSNSWLFSAPSNIVLPAELKPTFDSFTEFYSRQHSSRKLTWLYQHSKGELQTFFTSPKYILQVSTYQMVVLLLFNKSFSCTIEQIQDETQIKSELLNQILCSLLKSKILLCTEINEDFEQVGLKMNYTIKLVTDFKSEKLLINLNIPLKSIEQKDVKGLDKTINEEREMVIQAAIVRIMKARQTLKHSLLMQEIIQQLSSRFKPSISIIKKCIDTLIEKEYLERDSNEKDVLRYLT